MINHVCRLPTPEMYKNPTCMSQWQCMLSLAQQKTRMARSTSLSTQRRASSQSLAFTSKHGKRVGLYCTEMSWGTLRRNAAKAPSECSIWMSALSASKKTISTKTKPTSLGWSSNGEHSIYMPPHPKTWWSGWNKSIGALKKTVAVDDEVGEKQSSWEQVVLTFIHDEYSLASIFHSLSFDCVSWTQLSDVL